MEKNSRILICGPICSGKSFLVDRFVQRGYNKNISYTTRLPRKEEKNGQSYYFITEESFNNLIISGLFQEYSKHADILYGTSKKEWNNKDIFIKEPTGISKIFKEDRLNTFIIYLNIPFDIIRNRLKERNLSNEKIQKRLLHDQIKFENFTDYDLEIKNPYF